MRKLVDLIENELKDQEICAVYNSELERVWPKTINPRKRKQQIKRFAEENHLAVTFYDVGLCAVFERLRRNLRDGEVLLSLPVSKRQKPGRKPRGN
jgi:hypothetical protein